jgi:hypothetical protein
MADFIEDAELDSPRRRDRALEELRARKWKRLNAPNKKPRTDIDVMASVRDSLMRYAATWRALADK